VTAVVAVTLARQGRLALDESVGDQLAPTCCTAGPLSTLCRAPPRGSCLRTPPACPTTSAFAFYAAGYDAVLVGTHTASHVDRWPLVAALCQQLRDTSPVEPGRLRAGLDGGGQVDVGSRPDGMLPDRSNRP
jgi:hypothetical protein